MIFLAYGALCRGTRELKTIRTTYVSQSKDLLVHVKGENFNKYS